MERRGVREAVPQWGICRRQKLPERVLPRAVRESRDYDSAVRVRNLAETSNATAPREQCED